MFKNINEIKKANKEAGYHYWEPSTVRFFQGKTLPEVYGGRYFVDSIQPPHGPRQYAVKAACANGSISSITSGIDSLGSARALALLAADDWEPVRGVSRIWERAWSVAVLWARDTDPTDAEYHPGLNFVRFSDGHHVEVS